MTRFEVAAADAPTSRIMVCSKVASIFSLVFVLALAGCQNTELLSAVQKNVAVAAANAATTGGNGTYAISYLGNGNDSGSPPVDPTRYLPGSQATIQPNSNKMARYNYVLAGWQDAATSTFYPADGSVKIVVGNADITLKAVWGHSVTYSGNGSTSGTAPVDSKIYREGVQGFDSVSILAPTGSQALGKSNGTFLAWNSSADGTGTWYTSSGSPFSVAATQFTIASANVTLYAQWMDNPIVTPTVSAGLVNLAWNSCANANSYNVYKSTTASTLGTKIASALTSASYADTSVVVGTIYYYTVTSYSNHGVESPTTNQISTAPPPPVPTLNTPVPGIDQITLTWSSVTGATSYNLYWDTATGVTRNSPNKITNATSGINLTNLDTSKTYYYVLTSLKNGAESAISNEANCVPSKSTDSSLSSLAVMLGNNSYSISPSFSPTTLMYTVAQAVSSGEGSQISISATTTSQYASIITNSSPPWVPDPVTPNLYRQGIPVTGTKSEYQVTLRVQAEDLSSISYTIGLTIVSIGGVGPDLSTVVIGDLGNYDSGHRFLEIHTINASGSAIAWCDTTDATNYLNTGTDGSVNTALIVAGTSTSAAQTCSGGGSIWFLPSATELSNVPPSAITSGQYWTSTEEDASDAYYYDTGTHNSGAHDLKTVVHLVRSARWF